MSKKQISVGLDVGTSNVRVIVAKYNERDDKPQIIGVGQAFSSGMRRGAVVDIEEVVKSIRQAVKQAEQTSGVPIEHVLVSVGDCQITSRPSKGVIAVSRADGEISKEDIRRVIEASRAISLPPNREIIHVIPRSFTIDGQEMIKDPEGMNGVRLEVDTLLIEGSIPFIKNLTKCINLAGLDIDDLVVSPIAASQAVLTKRQKELGVLALDIGGGTVGLTVFEEGNIIHSQVLPIGASHITNDIAIGLKTSIDVAERVKLEYGSVLPNEINKKEVVDLSKLEGEEGMVPRRHIAEIIEARMSEILDLVNKELKKIDRQALLPGGIVLVGGGAKTPGLIDLTKKTLALPVQIGFPTEIEGLVDKVDDPSFATAVGLIKPQFFDQKDIRENVSERKSLSQIGFKIKKWLKGFLP